MSLVIKLALYLLIAYLILLVAVFFLQRKLLYFPSHFETTSDLLAGTGLKLWPETDRFRGLLSEPADIPVIGTVIVFHGNGGPALVRDFYANALNPLGYRVILAEYPGYGGRPGKPAETALVTDARDIIREAHEQFGSPLFLMGESLGAGVTAAAITDSSTPVDGIVLITPWDNLPNLAQNLYPYIPVRWFLRDRYDSVGNLKSFNGPVAVAIADRDTIIPNRFSMNLFNSIQSEKHLWTFPGAGHNSWPISPNASWWQEAMNFVSD